MNDLTYHAKRFLPMEDKQGEESFIKVNRRLGNKLSARYRRENVVEN